MTTLPEKLKELDGEEFKIPMPWGHISGKILIFEYFCNNNE